MGSARVQWWTVMLQAYQYNIVYRPGKYNKNPDDNKFNFQATTVEAQRTRMIKCL